METTEFASSLIWCSIMAYFGTHLCDLKKVKKSDTSSNLMGAHRGDLKKVKKSNPGRVISKQK